jgi:hypothetical protein
MTTSTADKCTSLGTTNMAIVMVRYPLRWDV